MGDGEFELKIGTTFTSQFVPEAVEVSGEPIEGIYSGTPRDVDVAAVRSAIGFVLGGEYRDYSPDRSFGGLGINGIYFNDFASFQQVRGDFSFIFGWQPASALLAKLKIVCAYERFMPERGTAINFLGMGVGGELEFFIHKYLAVSFFGGPLFGAYFEGDGKSAKFGTIPHFLVTLNWLPEGNPLINEE